MSKEYRVEVKHDQGLVFYVSVQETPAPNSPEDPLTERKPRNDDGPKMTENQKRFMFRLLGAQKVEGKEAEKHLKDYFKVAAVNDITKVS